MATLGSELDRHKLETTFYDNHVVHTTYITNLATRQRRVPVKSKWIEKGLIGSGAFGIVALEEDEKGQLRAVKRYSRGLSNVNYTQELKQLVNLKEVCFRKI